MTSVALFFFQCFSSVLISATKRCRSHDVCESPFMFSLQFIWTSFSMRQQHKSQSHNKPITHSVCVVSKQQQQKRSQTPFNLLFPPLEFLLTEVALNREHWCVVAIIILHARAAGALSVRETLLHRTGSSVFHLYYYLQRWSRAALPFCLWVIHEQNEGEYLGQNKIPMEVYFNQKGRTSMNRFTRTIIYCAHVNCVQRA